MSLGIATPAFAQERLDAGKTPAQIFSSDCSVCHKSSQGLVRGNSLGLDSFLRQHYTSSKESASAMAGYLRAQGDLPAPAVRTAKPPKDKPAAETAQPASVEQPRSEPDFFRALFGGGPKEEPAAPAKPAKKPAKKPDPNATAAKPPADAKPADAKPTDAKASEPHPAEAAKPAEVKSTAESKPASAAPVEAKPVEAKPVEAKPADAKTE